MTAATTIVAMTPPSPSRLPPDVAERIHVYFASFLSPPAADQAMAELEVEARGSQAPLRDLLRRAHDKLAARVDVPREIELPVLVEDLGVPVGLAARAMDAPVEVVERFVAEHGLVVRDDPVWTVEPHDGEPEPPTTAPPSATWPPDEVAPTAHGAVTEPDAGLEHVDRPPPIFDADADDGPSVSAGDREASRRGPRPERATRAALFVVLAVLLAAVIAVALLAGGPGANACEPAADQPVCVVEARLTHVIDASGNPGAPRSVFELGEPVRLWFRYETLDPRRSYTVDYVWLREDELLYAAGFPLPPVGRVNLTLAQAVIEEPGDYRVEVRLGDDVLVDERLRITD